MLTTVCLKLIDIQIVLIIHVLIVKPVFVAKVRTKLLLDTNISSFG